MFYAGFLTRLYGNRNAFTGSHIDALARGYHDKRLRRSVRKNYKREAQRPYENLDAKGSGFTGLWH
ncbi:hypothetical protein W02_39980 [Nitrospira sp. KM1]|nr:hypothetical protein W02_39980 [Nitrospira sp. KM1]